MAGNFESIERCLETNIAENELKEINRVLYGKPCRSGVDFYYNTNLLCKL